MERDPVRDRLRELLWQRGPSMRETSITIGRNAAYIHQFLERGMPKALAFPDTGTLAQLLRCAAAGGGALNHEGRARALVHPEGMVRHEGGADPASLRILRVRGN